LLEGAGSLTARVLQALARAFRRSGALAAAIPGYRERPQQLEMAHAILDAIERNAMFCAEAGPAPARPSRISCRHCWPGER
jgi:hypothetical protein